MAGSDITFNIKAIDGTRAAFVSVSNSLGKLNKDAKVTSGLFKAGLGVLGAGTVFGLLTHQVREVISNIENIPGIPQHTRDSVIALRDDFLGLQGGIQGAIAKTLGFINEASEGIAIDIAVLLKGREAVVAALAERDKGRQQIADMKAERDLMEEKISLRAQLYAAEKARSLFEEAEANKSLSIQQRAVNLAAEGNRLYAKEQALRDTQDIPGLRKKIELTKELTEHVKAVAVHNEEATRAGRQFGEGIAHSFEAAVLAGGKLKDIVNSLIADMGAMLFRQMITTPLASGLGSFFGGFFAQGGTPPAGKISVVGERGPELLVGNGMASVVPGGMGGVTVHVSNYYSSGVQAAQLGQFGEFMKEDILAAVQQRARGRKLAI